MKRLMNSMTRYFETVPGQVSRHRLAVWLVFAAITAFCVMGFGRVRFDTSIEGWFEKDNPVIVAFDWFHHEFGSEDHLFIAYRAKDGDVLSDASLKALQQLQQELLERRMRTQEQQNAPLRHVVKITSLINAPILRAEGGSLISEKLVGAKLPSTPAERDKIRRIALSQKSFPGLYFSKDFQWGGILVETDFGAIPVGATGTAADEKAAAVKEVNFDEPIVALTPGERPKFQPTDLKDYIGLMDEVKAVLEQPRYAAHLEYFPVGATAAAEYNLAMATELGGLNVAALLIITALLWLIFRSLSAVVWPIVIVVLSTTWMIGITAWLGLPITFFVMVAIMLTLAVGVADVVHMISAYTSARRHGDDHATALRHGFRNVAVACLLTTITNIVAVVALSITPIVPIQVFAFMCALGVGLPFLFSVYLLPLMLDVWAPKAAVATEPALPGRAGSGALSRWIPDLSAVLERQLEKVLPAVEKAPRTIIAFFLAMFIVCIYGAFQTQVNTDPVGYFPKDSRMRESVKMVDQHMIGAQSMEIYLDLGTVNAFHDPFVLKTIEKLQSDIESRYKDFVVRTSSIADTTKASYKALNEDREDRYVIPDNRNAVSQTLFLFNQSTPDDRRKLVSDNYNRSHISVRLYNKGSYEYGQAWAGIQDDIARTVDVLKVKYPAATVSMTGMLPLMMQGADYLTSNELQSFTVSIVLVSLVLLVLFGSTKAGVIALVPNLIPAILAYGVLGLRGKPLDITTMMIAPIIIGIAVDDTVHFITHYRNEVVRDGDIRRALLATIRHSGQSVVFTSMILGLGFGILGFAGNGGVANLGIYGFLAILMGLLNDLFLLPAAILVFKLRFDSGEALPEAAATAQVTS